MPVKDYAYLIAIMILTGTWLYLFFKNFKKNKRKLSSWLVFILFFPLLQASILLLVLSFYPMNEIVSYDGDITPANELITGSNKTNLHVVSVNSSHVNNMADHFIQQSLFWRNPEFGSASEELGYRTVEEDAKFSRTYYLESKERSFAAASNFLNANNVKKEIIINVLYSQFKNNVDLQEGDKILSFDGIKVESKNHFFSYINEKNPKNVRLVIERDKRVYEKSLNLDKRYYGIDGLGFWPIEHLIYEKPKTNLTIKDGLVDGGDSAGLIMALQLVNEFRGQPLTTNKIIVGTGGIQADGTVNGIGGVSHKVSSAIKNNADIFFVPMINAEEAKNTLKKEKEKGDIRTKIVPISNLAEAVRYLDNHVK